MTPIIVSYYTKNSLYEKQVEDLIRSCEELGLSYDIEGIESLGSWSKNCSVKPSFLLQKWQKYKRPIVWTDADSVVMRRPELFEKLTCDLAVHIREHLPVTDCAKVLSGTIFVGYTEKGEELLKLWQAECQKDILDQEALRDVIYHGSHGARIETLPSSYCHIFDKEECADAVFVHYQASRIERLPILENEILRNFLEQLDSRDLKAFQRSIPSDTSDASDRL